MKKAFKLFSIAIICFLYSCTDRSYLQGGNSEPELIAEKDSVKVYEATHNLTVIYFTVSPKGKYSSIAIR